MEGEEGGNFKERRGRGEGLLKRDARRLQESPEGGGKGLGRRVRKRGRGKGDGLQRDGEEESLGEAGAEGTGKRVSLRGRRRRVPESGEGK